jgi:hypothetical protein
MRSPVFPPDVKTLERNASDLADASVGDWRPSRENVGEDVFDHVPISFVIMLGVVLKESFEVCGSAVGLNLSH